VAAKSLRDLGFPVAMVKVGKVYVIDVEACVRGKLLEALDKVKNRYVMGPIDSFIVSIDNTLGNTLKTLYASVSSIATDLASVAVEEAATKLLKANPAAAAVYAVANSIHQVFSQTITSFSYDIKPQDGVLVESQGQIRYLEDDRVTGTVQSEMKDWIQGCIRGLMAGIVGALVSPGAARALNYLPQVFIFDIDFSKNDPKIFTGGKPRVYLLNGNLTFPNAYDSVTKFFNGIVKNLLPSENKKTNSNKKTSLPSDYSIFTDIIENELKGSMQEEQEGATKSSVKIFVPFIVGSAFSVVENIMDVSDDAIHVKMAAILDMGSFIRPTIQNVVEGLKKDINEGAEKLKESIKNILENVVTTIKTFLKSLKKQLIKVVKDNDLLKTLILNTVVKGIVISKVDEILNEVKQVIEKRIEEIYIIKEKRYLKIIPKRKVDLTEYFDKVDLNVEAIENWKDFEKRLYGVRS